MDDNKEGISGGHSNLAFQHDTVHSDDNKERKLLKQEVVSLGDCSLLCLNLKFLNIFRNPSWFLVFLSCAAFLQGLCINGFVNVVITSIEKRFGLKSTQSGLISSTYDIGSLLVMIPVSFFGGRRLSSKPRWIGLGLLCQALGSLMWTIPHFATPIYDKSGSSEDGISSNATSQLCSSSESFEERCPSGGGLSQGGSLSNYRFVFILGQLLHGFGAAPLVTLGTTFLDDIVKIRNSPFYIGIFFTWFMIGPAVGFILGKEF